MSPKVEKDKNETQTDIQVIETWSDVFKTITLSEKKMEYFKTSVYSGILLLFSLTLGAWLIIKEANKTEILWKEIKALGIELPSPFYILVILIGVNFIIIFGTKVMAGISSYISGKFSKE